MVRGESGSEDVARDVIDASGSKFGSDASVRDEEELLVAQRAAARRLDENMIQEREA